MTDAVKQIPLAFEPQTDFRREDFMVADCNKKAFAMIDRWPEWSMFGLFLYGPEGCGKTHLAHIFADRVARLSPRPVAVQMINAREVKPSKVERLYRENPCLVVENLTAEADNTALFHLFNLYQNEGGSVLFTSSQAPARLAFTLPDLCSRIRMLPAVAITEPDDAMLEALVVKLFTDRQIVISSDVLNFIVQNTQRSFSFVQKFVAEIDTVSLAYKRAVSVPIAREALKTLLAVPEQLELF
jgi:chromosomal replication initiation ATPase DnaA